MNKTDLIQKIKQLEGITADERSYLINLVNTKKKYGLVWEDKPEDVEEQLRESLPVLKEVKEKRILAKDLPETKENKKDPELFEADNHTNPKNHSSDYDAPNHILIEGDNLHALTALTFTHEGKIDVIYIDPPYNTGNKDFKYNDHFVDKEDSYRHSKWLSFMSKRLEIAKRLLTKNGAIFISIDDNEQAQLKMLCDEIFGAEYFLNNIIWQKKYSPQNDAKYFSDNHDFILVYRGSDWVIRHLERSEIQKGRYSNRDNDPRGDWKAADLSVKRATEKDIYEIVTPSGRKVLPPQGRSWVLSKDKFQEFAKNNRIWFGESGNNVPALKIFLSEAKEGITPLTIWTYEEVGHNQSAKQEMKSVLFDVPLVFDTPKPIKLIDRILRLTTDNKKSYKILDFFAGSGTTLIATMQINDQDSGNRQCILVTNNENNICEEVTYERNKRVIEGYTNSKGQQVEGLTNNNLRYYKSEFVPSVKTEKNRRLLTETSTDLLCIKEDCYTDITEENGFKPKECRIFKNEGGKMMMVIYHSRRQLSVCEELIAYIKSLEPQSEAIKLYAFSPEKESLAEEFVEVADRIEAIPLPDAIYNAYRATFRLLKLNKKQVAVPSQKAEAEEELATTLFPNEEEA